MVVGFLIRFNTSHVTINHKDSFKHCIILSFNTSHVTINQKMDYLYWKIDFSFNTSHVTINQISFFTGYGKQAVSIHLMLLLILCSLYTCASIIVSIHLMLLLIWLVWSKNKRRQRVSIHLMLLLIRFWQKSIASRCKFQYISCYY